MDSEDIVDAEWVDLNESAELETEERLPWEQGRFTIFVYLDERGEVQVGVMNADNPSPAELGAMVGVAKAKFELLDIRMMRKQMEQQFAQQQKRQLLHLPS